VIGVDTNVLVRLLTADDEEQHRIALKFFEARSQESPAFVSAVTLAETIWVLRRSYGFSADDVLSNLSAILDSDDFVVESRQAVQMVRDGQGNAPQLVDFIIAQLGLRAGCARTVTFDRSAARAIPSMELLA